MSINYRRLAVLALIPAVAALAGCAATSATTGGAVIGTATPSSPSDQVNAIFSTVAADAQKVCGFVPTIETVANIVTTLYSPAQVGVTFAEAIAENICSAVNPKAAGRRGAAVAPVYPGTTIAIHGSYVGRSAIHRAAHATRHRRGHR